MARAGTPTINPTPYLIQWINMSNSSPHQKIRCGNPLVHTQQMFFTTLPLHNMAANKNLACFKSFEAIQPE